ncbi:hypothetical protein FRC04_004336 [Tulasnella sp. 424]|nr:hypothetical protein FRC04_004336 [Tulasnella sp. 424]KAG8979452.1 hypothetical protein FRC05_008438 [Tulasnella sp. 425]
MSDIESHPGRQTPTLRDGPGSAAPILESRRPPLMTRLRRRLRQLGAEFLGTFLLVFFGTAANCQTVLLSNGTHAKGDWLSGAVGWGVGIALGVFVSAAVSGGHINPAVTLTKAIFRRFPWKKVPFYWAAQLLGAFVGSLLTYAIYRNAIDQFEGKGVRTVPGTAGLFGTFPLDYVPDVVAFFNEFLATIFLVLTIFAATDRNNCPPSPAIVALAVFFAMTGITAVIGAQTSFAMNPARDLGPRMMSAMFYGRKAPDLTSDFQIADFTGALAGAVVYDLLIYIGPESPIAYRPVPPPNERYASPNEKYASGPPDQAGALYGGSHGKDAPPSPTTAVHVHRTQDGVRG